MGYVCTAEGKLHFCFDKICTAKEKRLISNLLVLVLMDLNLRQDGKGSIDYGQMGWALRVETGSL